jgi:RNA recognition motif-containing protein
VVTQQHRYLSLYIGNVPHDWDVSNFKALAEQYGKVRDVAFFDKRGYGFAHFCRVQESFLAFIDLHKRWLDGGELQVEVAHRHNSYERREELIQEVEKKHKKSLSNVSSNVSSEGHVCTLYVNNVDEDVVSAEPELAMLFHGFGRVTWVRLVKAQPQNKKRGYGFVTFERAEDAALAMEYVNQALVGDKRVHVSWAEQKR